MRRVKPLWLAAAATVALLAGCRSSDGDFRDGVIVGAGGGGDTASISSTLVAAQAEIANNNSETSGPRDTTTVASREDDPETMVPVAVSFPAGT